MARIVLINPRFEVSYFGFEHMMPIVGKSANMPVACLPLLAALTPEKHEVVLLDENVEEIDFDSLLSADIVGVTGMVVQRFRMREILEELKKREIFTVVGGPWVTVSENYFDGLNDVIFVGEAEDTWPLFLREWESGTFARRYEQEQKTDLTRVPVPRFDLLRMERYLFGSIQFSRGCPFQCEFCDIIVTFGRKPRLKTFPQIKAELDALRATGIPIVFIVDDNLIGNKKAIKPLLRELVEYQQKHGYPFQFTTEASLDLAEDAELMDLMGKANIVQVFVGIESPNLESLREAKKFQNLRGEEQGAPIVERVRRIQGAGIEVMCGMIVGFDHDDGKIFDAQREFITQASICHAMVGMLSAIPKTPLHARLAEAGRLDTGDPPEFGTNVIPLLIGREELRDGYTRLLNELHEPDAFFQRVDDLYIRQGFRIGKGKEAWLRRRPLRRMGLGIVLGVQALVLTWRLVRHVREPGLSRDYLKRIARFARAVPRPLYIFLYVLKCGIHYHQHTLARDLAQQDGRFVNTF